MCGAEGVTVENAGLCAVDEHAPESQLANDFVQGPFRDEPFFEDVGETVERSAQKRKQIALDCVGSAKVIGAGDVVRAKDDAQTTDAEQDAEDLRVVVADLEEDE